MEYMQKVSIKGKRKKGFVSKLEPNISRSLVHCKYNTYTHERALGSVKT